MLHFVLQLITVTDHNDRWYDIEAQVALREDGAPVGLAVHPVYDLGPGSPLARPDEYTVTHVKSGSRLFSQPVPTEWTARRWLTLVADLTDWTRTSGARGRSETLRLQIALARVQALEEGESEQELPPLRLPAAPPTFDLDSLTWLLEWMIFSREFVALPEQARAALASLLAIHADLAQHRQRQLETATLPTGGRP